MLSGVDLSSPSPGIEALDLDAASPGQIVDAMHRSLAGSFTHTILEWSAFCVALFTIALALIHFRIRRGVVTPIIAVSLFWGGCMDAFHTLAADRLIEATADNQNLIPFTWAICRLFNALIPIIGAVLILSLSRRKKGGPAVFFISAISVLFGLIAYAVIHLSAVSQSLPQTMFEDSWITRPWDVAPLLLYIFAGVVVYPRLYRSFPGEFSLCVWFSVIPDVATQLYMVFGSTRLFDASFNAAHFVKIIAYLVPFCGIALNYIRIHREQAATLVALARAEQESREARLAAEAASEAKGEFLANMSHEIRTPMVAVTGYIDLLERTSVDLPSTTAQWITQMRRSAGHLVSVINDILDLSKIEAGQVVIATNSVSVVEVVGDVNMLMNSQAREKLIDLHVVYEGEIPERIFTDPVRLRQILVNLVGNAIKFTEEGSVVIRVGVHTGDDDGGCCLRIHVEDTGIGIPSKRLAEAFEPFTQLNAESKVLYGGTGLGLDISGRLAQLLGGSLTAESELGSGSTFTLALPYDVDARMVCVEELPAKSSSTRTAEPRLRGSDRSLHGARILLVDDNPDNRQIITFLLEEAQAKVGVACDGIEGVEAVHAAVDSGSPFHLILMDMRMPRMDGYTATAKLRADGITTPIIALTALAMTGDKEKCLAAGCDVYATKPVEPRVLLETIHKQLECVPGLDLARTGAPLLVSNKADDAAFAPILALYIAGFPTAIEAIETARDAGDVDGLSLVLHRLTGTGRSYGFPSITEVARWCESALRSGASLAEIDETLRRLITLLRAAVTAASEKPSEPVTQS